MTRSNLTVSEHASSAELSLIKSPTALNLNAVDLKAAPATEYVTPVLDLRGYINFNLTFILVNAGAASTAGAAELLLDVFSDAAGSVVVFQNLKLADITTNQASATYDRGVIWNTAAALVQVLRGAAGVVALTANAFDAFRGASFVKLKIKVTTSNNSGTSSTGTVHLLAT